MQFLQLSLNFRMVNGYDSQSVETLGYDFIDELELNGMIKTPSPLDHKRNAEIPDFMSRLIDTLQNHVPEVIVFYMEDQGDF